jgi:hypothetical protein
VSFVGLLLIYRTFEVIGNHEVNIKMLSYLYAIVDLVFDVWSLLFLSALIDRRGGRTPLIIWNVTI